MRNAGGMLLRSPKCKGKARPFMRPDMSQEPETGAGGPALSDAVAELVIATDQPLSSGRSSRLVEALAGLTWDLAAARREIAALKRENAALRSQRDLIGAR